MATYPRFIFTKLATHSGIFSLIEENCAFRERFFGNSQDNTIEMRTVTLDDFFATLPDRCGISVRKS